MFMQLCYHVQCLLLGLHLSVPDLNLGELWCFATVSVCVLSPTMGMYRAMCYCEQECFADMLYPFLWGGGGGGG